MRIKKRIVFVAVPALFIVCVISSCVRKSEYLAAIGTIDSLQTENKRLIIENDELKNGEQRLAGLFNYYVSRGKFVLAEDTYKSLKDRHPNFSDKDIESRIHLVQRKAQVQRDSINKAIRDSIKLANIGNIGSWKIGSYVNHFDEPTGEQYVYQSIVGSFSNSATAGRQVLVEIRLSKDRGKIKPYFRFDEYINGVIDQTASFFSYNRWTIVCKDIRKVYYSAGGLDFTESDTNKTVDIVDILRQGHNYQFTYKPGGYGKTVYSFSVNTEFLENALVKARLLSIDDIL